MTGDVLEKPETEEPENIEASDSEEWQKIGAEWGLNFDDVEGVDFQGSTVGGEGASTGPDPASEAEKIAAAQMAISAGLQFAVSTISGLDIKPEKYADTSKAWAALIVKHYRGGVFEFLAVFREELAAIGATLMFIAAVREASKAKKAKDVTPEDVEAGDVEPA